MTMDTYNAIMAYVDQFIGHEMRTSTWGWDICILAENKETIKAVVDIARSNNLKVAKRIIGKGSKDAEMHLRIR